MLTFSPGRAGEVRTALHLRDSGKLPPVDQAFRQPCYALDGIAQLDGVSGIENLRTVAGCTP